MGRKRQKPRSERSGLFLQRATMNDITSLAIHTVNGLMSRWAGAPSITVVPTVRDLPAKNVPSDVRGMHRAGETWIVAEAHQRPSLVGYTVAHEALGHHAMRETFGKTWRSLMHAVADGASSGDMRLHGFRSYIRGTYVDANGNCNLSKQGLADEMTAAIVEQRFNDKSGRLEIDRPAVKLAMAAKGVFAREVLYLDSPATFHEVEGSILAAEHVLRHGSPFWGLAFQIKRLYAAAMSNPWDPKASPMSLADSERLLKAEKDRIQNIEELKGIGHLIISFVLVLVVLVGAGSMLMDLFNGFRH